VILAIDVGNTNTVFGLIDASDKLLDSWRIHSDREKTGDEYAVLFDFFFDRAGIDAPGIRHVLLASVVPSISSQIAEYTKKHLQAELFDLDYTHLKHHKWDIENPAEVGADRLCNIAGAYYLYGGPVIIIDFGTAITFDVVLADGTYAGGAISPGLETTMANLHQKAAKLPAVSLEYPPNIIGKNTIEHIQSGIMYGAVAMVDGMIQRYEAAVGSKCKVIATGGMAARIRAHSEHIDEILPDLILKGLLTIFRQHQNA
jgi:type III pantothenate kinase